MENTRNAYQLAHLADCSAPNGPDSPGAKMLMGIAEEVYDNVDELREASYVEDYLVGIVDGWPSIYTHEMWAQFVDLGAWEEDPPYGENMYDQANACLYQIGERLAYALWEEIKKDLPEVCEDCQRDLIEDHENVVCEDCAAEREADEAKNLEADIRDGEAQVAGDPS